MLDVYKAIIRTAKEKQSGDAFTSGFGEVREFQKKLVKEQKSKRKNKK